MLNQRAFDVLALTVLVYFTYIHRCKTQANTYQVRYVQ